jgi:type VI secretion system secreted protein VgrG
MGARSAPASPSFEPNDAGPVMGVNGVCCWCEDYEDDRSPLANRVYYRRHHDGAPEVGSNQKWFRLFVLLKSGFIKVQVRFKYLPYGPTTPDEVNAAIRGLTAAAQSWTGHIRIRIEDPLCGPRVLPVQFEALNVSSVQHYTVTVFQWMPPEFQVKGEQRAHVEHDQVRLLTSTTREWTFTHEFAHCLGLPDEYGYSPDDIERVTYITPQGPPDPPIDVDIRGAASRGQGINVMSTHGQYTRCKRHGYFVAIETQELLTEVLGRPIRCFVESPAE